MASDDKLKELLDFLAKDEEEAINGYDDVIAKISNPNLKKQLEIIRDEEKAHLEFLERAKENPNVEYEEVEEELKEARKVFKMDL